METNKLKTFIDLAKTLSFSETAENLFITQSSVSKHIKSLEKELNCQLFIRNNKKVILSPYGRKILPEAQNILLSTQKIEQDIEQIRESNQQEIKIGTIPTMSKYTVFSDLTTYTQQNPQINLIFNEVESSKLVNQVENDQFDMAFIRSFVPDMLHFESIPVTTENFTLCLSTHDPLAKKKVVDLAQLKDHNFILLAKDSMLYQPAVDLCLKAGFTPNVIFKSYRLGSITQMVAQDQGVSLLMNKPEVKNKVKFIPIKPTKTSYLMFIRKKKEHRLIENQLWQYLKSKYSKVE